MSNRFCVVSQVSSINRVLRNLAAQKEQTHQPPSQQQTSSAAASTHHSGNNNNNNNGNDSPGATLCDSVYDKLRLLNGHHHHTHPHHVHLGTSGSHQPTSGHHPSVASTANCWPPRPPSWYPGALNGGSGAFALQSISPGGGSVSGGIGSCTVLSADEINSKKGE
jgi:hypothetical protein